MEKTSNDQLPQLIILDSNIIQYTAQPKSADAFNVYIVDLVSRGFEFAISAITIYELLKGANKKTKEKMVKLLKQFTKFELPENVLETAAELESVYKVENIQPKEIEDADKIIGATALLSYALILTANARDFPAPYFKEIERKIITFEEKRERTKTIVIYLLKPEATIIEKHIQEIP